MGDAEFGTEWDHHVWTIRAHPQDILENGIDWPHVMPVRLRLARGALPLSTGPCIAGARHGQGDRTARSTARGVQFSRRHLGLGLSQVRYDGLFSVVFQIGQTPVDETHTRLSFSILTRARDRSEPEVAAALRRYIDDNVRTLEQDFPIWENKIYREHPLLCEADGPILKFRRWAAQFYPCEPGIP